VTFRRRLGSRDVTGQNEGGLRSTEPRFPIWRSIGCDVPLYLRRKQAPALSFPSSLSCRSRRGEAA
jgi:hypothetical protein